MITIGFLMVGPSGPYFGSSLTENLDETFLSRFARPFPLFFTNLVYAFNYTSIGSHQFAWWAPSFLGVTWSISLEEQMYLIFPVLLSLAMRWPRVTLICLIAFAMLARIGFLFIPVWNASMENAGGMYYTTFSYLDLFALGGLAGWAKARGQVPKIFSRNLLGPILVCALVGVGILWHKVSWHPYGWYAPLIYFALAVLIRSLILWTIESRGIVTWVFGNTADAGAWSAILWDIPLAFNRN